MVSDCRQVSKGIKWHPDVMDQIILYFSPKTTDGDYRSKLRIKDVRAPVLPLNEEKFNKMQARLGWRKEDSHCYLTDDERSMA